MFVNVNLQRDTHLPGTTPLEERVADGDEVERVVFDVEEVLAPNRHGEVGAVNAHRRSEE